MNPSHRQQLLQNPRPVCPQPLGAVAPNTPLSTPGHLLPPPARARAVLAEAPQCNGSNKLLLNN